MTDEAPAGPAGTADTEAGARGPQGDAIAASTFEPLHFAEDGPSQVVPGVSRDQDAGRGREPAPSVASGHQGTEEPALALPSQPGVSEDYRQRDGETLDSLVPGVPEGAEADLEESAAEGHVQLQPFKQRSRRSQKEVRVSLYPSSLRFLR